jgi:hypothetical protein
MSPKDIGETLSRPLPHQVAKKKPLTKVLSHAWLLEHDEEYRKQFFANFQARNTANMKKYQVETVLDDGSGGSFKGDNKKVFQPVTEMSPGNDPNISKNWNNNVRPTADMTDELGSTTGNDKSASITGNDKSESTTNSWIKRMIPGDNPKPSENRNNNARPTTDGTEKLVSTEGLIARLHKMEEDLSFS